ncbi:MAG TPA: hypothetical protein VLE47_01695 [Candidatus Saccharimonadales bacterium]|nr:hypothetical protein [Candidatus Saccharimonadales bacterium]
MAGEPREGSVDKHEVFKFAEGRGFRCENFFGEDPTACARIIGPDGVELPQQVADGVTEIEAVTNAIGKALAGFVDFSLLRLNQPGVKLERPHGEDLFQSKTHIWLTGSYNGNDFSPRGDARDDRFAKAYGLALLRLCGDIYLKEQRRSAENQAAVAVAEELVTVS